MNPSFTGNRQNTPERSWYVCSQDGHVLAGGPAPEGRNPYEELQRVVSSNEMISRPHAVSAVDTSG